MQRSAAGSLSWCGTVFPTEASAQDAEMSLREYEDFVFQAGYLDHHDPVGKPDRRKPMRDDHHRAILREPLDRLGNEVLRLRVELARGFIKNQD